MTPIYRLAAVVILVVGLIPDFAHGASVRRQGHRAPTVAINNGTTDYYEHIADKLPFGSRRWRDQMRRENRLGNPG